MFTTSLHLINYFTTPNKHTRKSMITILLLYYTYYTHGSALRDSGIFEIYYFTTLLHLIYYT
jgi:hypothetical protein